MKNLIKADLFRILKSRLLIVVLILAVVIPLFSVLMQVSLVNMLGDKLDMGLDMLINARTQIYGAYSLSDNVGLIIPIFSGIYVFSDFSSGMVRNKIIQGYSRFKIFTSHLLTSMLFNACIITLYFLCVVAFSRIFFSYGVEFKDAEVKMMIYYIILGTLTFMFMASITTFFALNFKTMVPVIIFTILFCFGLNIITSVFGMFDYEEYKYILYLVPTFVGSIPLQSGILASSTERLIDLEAFLLGASGIVIFYLVFTSVGYLIFRKKELK